MDITFNVQHAFSPDSPPQANVDARRILHDCQVRLNHAQPTNGIQPVRCWVNGRLVVWSNLPAFSQEYTFDQNAFVLRCLLDCLIELNLSFLKYGGNIKIPTLYESPVVYDRTLIWDTIPALYALGHGDCKSLTAALIAQYRFQGIDCAPVFRFIPRKDGGLDFHILVQTMHGFEDPSKVKGMGRNEVAPIRGLE